MGTDQGTARPDGLLDARHPQRVPGQAPAPLPRPGRVALAVAYLVVAFGVATALVVSGATTRMDGVTWPWFTAFDRPGAAHFVLRSLVNLGQFWIVGLVVAVVAAVLSLRRRRWTPLLVGGTAMVGMDVSLWVIKQLTGRTAPHSGVNEVLAGGTSYPSGHAAHATIGLFLLASMIAWWSAGPAAGSRSRLLFTLAATGSLIAGLTTVMLGYHWVMDVVAGWLVGMIMFLPAHLLLRRDWVAVDAASRAGQGESAATAVPRTGE